MSRDKDAVNDAIVADLFGWLRPTNDETSECLANHDYHLRGWDLHRHSGAPIENFSSYYWTPPPFSYSPIWSKQLREKLAEMGYGWMLYKLVGCKFSASLFRDMDGPPDFMATADSEEACILECALKLLEGQKP